MDTGFGKSHRQLFKSIIEGQSQKIIKKIVFIDYFRFFE